MSYILIALAILIIALIVGIPVPFAFFASGLSIVILGGYDYSFLPPYAYSKVGAITLIAIPLFIIAGAFMEKSGIAESLINWVTFFLGRLRGGLAVILTVSCALFGAISGSGMAALTCIGSIMLPRMHAAGYPKGLCAALVSSASVLALLIPPSMDMIIYGWVGGQSILASFAATVVPGVILVILLSIVSLFLLRNNQDIRIPDAIPKGTKIKEFKRRTWSALPALLAPVIILGGIYGGFLTPTEAAAVSVVYSLPVGIWIYKGLSLNGCYQAIVQSAITTGVIMVMLIGVMMLSRLYIMEDLPGKILDFMYSLSTDPRMLLLMVNICLIFIGMLMDDSSAILLATPIFLPIVLELGISGIHFAAILGVNLGMGCVTPPCAPFLFLGARIGQSSIASMMKPNMYYLVFAWLPTLILTTYVPGLSLWLPSILGLI